MSTPRGVAAGAAGGRPERARPGVRVPVVRQTGASDCGLAALEMVLRYHGARYERHELRRLLGGTAGGASLESLCTAARACGFDAEGFEAPPDMLNALPAPAILHWRRGHFVVFEGVDGGRVRMVDPVGGRVLMPREELARSYSGFALVLEPSLHGAATGGPETGRPAAPHPGSEFSAARSVLAPWAREERPGLVRLGASALAMGAAGCAGVWWMGRAIAGTVQTGPVHSVPAICAAALGVGAAAGLGVYTARLEAQLTGTLGDHLARRFARVVANVPHEYLASRTGRFLENLAGDLDPAVNPRVPSLGCIRMLALAWVAAAALLFVSGEIGLAVLACLALIMAGAEWRDRRWRRGAMRWRGAVQGAREWGRAVFARPVDLRAAGALTSALERWTELRGRSGHAGASFARPEPHVGLPGAAFVALALLAGRADAAGRLGHGEAIAALVLGVTALVSTHAAAGEAQRFRAWTATLAALADAGLEVPARPAPAQAPMAVAGAMVRCRSLSCVAGGHGRLSSTTLDVGPGEAVAVLGDAGARTAFAHLVLGLIHPSTGTVTIAGIDAARLEEPGRHSLVAGVLAGAEPLAATILDNFRVVAPACGRAAVLDACARAGLRDWLSSLPLGELTPLHAGTLPGAVPRLLCLARLLVHLPRVLVLDGTVDELSVEEARALATSLHALGCTVVLCTGRADLVPPEFRIVRVSSSDAA